MTKGVLGGEISGLEFDICDICGIEFLPQSLRYKAFAFIRI